MRRAPVALLPVSLATSGSFSFSVAHSCHVIVTAQAGVVRHVAMTGNNGGLTGRGAACEPIFGNLVR